MEMTSELHFILRLSPEGVAPQEAALAEELQSVVDGREAHVVAVAIERLMQPFGIEMAFHSEHPGEYGEALRGLPESVLLEVARKLIFGLSPRLFVGHLECHGGSAKVLKTQLSAKHFVGLIHLLPTPENNAAGEGVVKAKKQSIKKTMKKYRCVVCDWIYDPAVGDPEGGIAPGTAFEDIPNDWVCPVCGVGKDDFEPEPDE